MSLYVLRSDTPTPRGGFKPDKDGNLRTVTRQEISLKEYGPAIFAAYPDAAIVGVRAELEVAALSDEQILALHQRLSALTSEPSTDGTSPEVAPAEPIDDHSKRQIQQKLLRIKMRERGIL